MSYIRSLGNPEHLYIWAELLDGNVHIVTMEHQELLKIPTEVFNTVLDRITDGQSYVEYKGATFRPCRGKNRFDKYILSYRGWPRGGVRAWAVTWNYIARHTNW